MLPWALVTRVPVRPSCSSSPAAAEPNQAHAVLSGCHTRTEESSSSWTAGLTDRATRSGWESLRVDVEA